jgi:hypothetical protein
VVNVSPGRTPAVSGRFVATDGLATLPYARSALVVAFGYRTRSGVVFGGITSYTGKDLSRARDAFDPGKNTVPLPKVAYAVRRRPSRTRPAREDRGKSRRFQVGESGRIQ